MTVGTMLGCTPSAPLTMAQEQMMKALRFADLIRAAAITTYLMSAAHTAAAQQAPPQKPRCQAGEVLQQGKCVARKPSAKHQHGIVEQSSEEHHPKDNTPGGGVRIPRCQPGEILVDDHCVKE